MEAQEKNLSHTESLAIIQNMISMAKNSITDDGFHFLLWGVLVIVASLSQYILATLNYNHNDLPWLIMIVIGVPAAFIYEWRKKKIEKVKTHFDTIFGVLWGAVGVSIFSVIFISVKGGLSPVPFILTVVGTGTFVSGNILKFKPLVWGGVIFWIAAIGASFVEPATQLLINGIATFIGYIVPGILLWKNYKTETNV